MLSDLEWRIRLYLARLFAIARNAGYRGYFSMEADTSGDPYANTQELAQATLKYLAS